MRTLVVGEDKREERDSLDQVVLLINRKFSSVCVGFYFFFFSSIY